MTRAVGVLLLAVTTVTAAGTAQQPTRALGLDLEMHGRLHLQGATSSTGGGQGLFVRRARIKVDLDAGDRVSARIQSEVAGGDPTLKDAYLSVRLAGSHEVSIGQFKRPFTNFELASSTDLPIIERDGRMAGLDVCPAVSGPCSLSRLTQELGFDGRDVGVRLKGSLPGDLAYQASVTNGEGPNTGDVNETKSFSARLSLTRAGVTVGVFGALHDHPGTSVDGVSGTDYARAGGLDVEVGTWRDGFHLMGTLVAGGVWRAGPGTTFRAAQAMGGYYHALDAGLLDGIEPVLRVSWADPDVADSRDAALLWTPGLMLYVSDKNAIGVNLDLYSPAEGPTEQSLKVQTYLYF